MQTLTIVDSFGIFFQNYYAFSKANLTNSQGFPTGMITGVLNFINELESKYKTQYIIFALDSKGDTFRHKMYEKYKANRKEAPDDIKQQLPVMIDLIKKMGFATCEMSGYEADDIIASAAKFGKENDIKVKIISADKDLYQLIEDGKISIFNPKIKKELTSEDCIEKFGVAPNMIRDYLSILGDSSDNVPGIPGIGTKGVKELLNQFGSLEKIYDNLPFVLQSNRKKALIQHKENAFLSQKLVTLNSDLNVIEDIKNCLFPHEPFVNIIDELEKYEFTKILNKLKQNKSQKPIIKKDLEFKAITLSSDDELFEIVDNIDKNAIVAFDTETNSVDTKKANIVGFSFATDLEKAYYVPLSHENASQQVSLQSAKIAIEKLFTHKIVGQNIKFDFHVIYKNFNIIPPIAKADTMIQAWLINTTQKVGLDPLAKKYFNYEMVPFSQMLPNKKHNFSHVNVEDATKYAAEDAWMTLKLYQHFITQLPSNIIALSEKIEYPFLNKLFEMENEGIRLDKKRLLELLEYSNQKIEKLKKEIFSLTETEFNINSVMQLAEVLFEKLALPYGKKTKTGYSTDESVLLAIKNSHAVVPKLLEYREIFKLQSTYLVPFSKLVNKCDKQRIYTSFSQVGTSTGRLSSREPNLQNIPVKSDLGRQIRECFVAKEGYSFVGLDYSQIELRLLAHFSQDVDMVKAFKEEKDIHLETAIKIFGEDQATEKRSVAKSINFGLLYGMGAYKLSETLDISVKEAKEYIEDYFNSFKTIKEFLNLVQEKAKVDGFVTTLLGRKRYFNYQKATPIIKASYDRESVNTLFQGSAADLIKLAMLEFSDSKIERFGARLLLQIHDELIFEVRDDQIQAFAEFAKKTMEEIYPLNVPLKTSVNIGKKWSELK